MREIKTAKLKAYIKKQPPKLVISFVVVMFALIGFTAFQLTNAATFVTSAEAETGTPVGNATDISLAGTSGGSAVQFGSTANPPPPPGGIMRVSPNGHYLLKSDGTPFFWMADTGWGMFSNLTRTEMDEYLITRKNQGFNVIQAVLAFKHNGNPRGLPYNGNVGSINEGFFSSQVDYGVAKAKELGLVLAIWPIWSDGQAGTNVNAGNAEGYGRYIGNRYRNDGHIIWVFGGDDSNRHPEIWRPMAKGIAIGQTGTEDYSKQLMSYHPRGDETSSGAFHNDAWLDFNTVQSGHCPSNPLPYDLVGPDYNRSPAKPVLDSEPMYENHPYCWEKPPSGNSIALDMRKMAYWDVFAGGFGHTYGDHIVWPFINGTHPFTVWGGGTNGNWRTAMQSEGAKQMVHVRKLMESRPFSRGVPDQSVIVGDAGGSMTRKQATRADDGSYLMVYNAAAGGFNVNLNKLSGTTVKAYWFNTRSGAATDVTVAKGASVAVSPPDGNDWVFVADDAARGFGRPGQ